MQWLQGGEAGLSLLLLGGLGLDPSSTHAAARAFSLGGSVVAGCDLAHEGPRV